jgi:hypothetical protein
MKISVLTTCLSLFPTLSFIFLLCVNSLPFRLQGRVGNGLCSAEILPTVSEPISIISVTAQALSAAKTAKEYIDGIIDAPKGVTATTRDLEALKSALNLLLTQLQDPAFKDVQALEPIVAMLNDPLINCTEESENLQRFVETLCQAVWCGENRSMESAGFQVSQDGDFEDSATIEQLSVEFGCSCWYCCTVR